MFSTLVVKDWNWTDSCSSCFCMLSTLFSSSELFSESAEFEDWNCAIKIRVNCLCLKKSVTMARMVRVSVMAMVIMTILKVDHL